MNFFLAAMCHFAADVGLQPTHVAQAKYRNWQAMISHSLCSCSLIGIVGFFTMGYPQIVLPWAGCFLCHLAIDSIKKALKLEGRARVRAQYVDQVLHLISLWMIFGL